MAERIEIDDLLSPRLIDTQRQMIAAAEAHSLFVEQLRSALGTALGIELRGFGISTADFTTDVSYPQM